MEKIYPLAMRVTHLVNIPKCECRHDDVVELVLKGKQLSGMVGVAHCRDNVVGLAVARQCNRAVLKRPHRGRRRNVCHRVEGSQHQCTVDRGDGHLVVEWQKGLHKKIN